MEYAVSTYNAVHACKLCPLNEVRLIATPAQPGARYQQGGLAVMVETAREDDNGVPINGQRVRKLFDKMLMKAGVDRADVLTMVRVRCAPPRGRVRDHEDAQIMCDTHTQAELAAYNPHVVLLMGGTTIEPIYGKKAGVMATHGTIAAKGPKHVWGERMYVATYHPAAALVESALEQTIIEDMRLAVSLA
jgi:uracil-DNA glycosylase family 4